MELSLLNNLVHPNIVRNYAYLYLSRTHAATGSMLFTAAGYIKLAQLIAEGILIDTLIAVDTLVKLIVSGRGLF